MLTELYVWLEEDDGWCIEYWIDAQFQPEIRGLTHGEARVKVAELMALPSL